MASSAGPGDDDPIRQQAVEWFMRLEAAPEDATLRAEIDAWLARDVRHRQAYDEAAMVLWDQPPKVEAVPEVSDGLPNGPVLYDSTKSRTRRWGLALIGLAAVAAIAFVAWPRNTADHQTGSAPRVITLDDGSKVTLDVHTRLNVAFTPSQRTVELLSGQAFFEVVAMPARPFVVTARGVMVRVTGTAFEVMSSDEGTLVAVQSGAVSVSETVLGGVGDLTAGWLLKLPRGRGPIVEPMRPDEVGIWRDRKLSFANTSLREAAGEIGRHLDTTILFAEESIADRQVTATVDLSRPDEALRTVVQLAGGRVTTLTPYLTVIMSRSLFGSP